MEKADDQKRKIFHGICIAILTALFIVLAVAALLKEDADEAALLHTAGCGIIMVMNILLFVSDKRTKIALLIFEIRTPLWFVLDLCIGFKRSDYGSFFFLESFVAFLSMFVVFCFIYIENNRKLRKNEMELTQSRLNSL